MYLAEALNAEVLSDERSETMRRHISASVIRLAIAIAGAVVMAALGLGPAAAVTGSVPVGRPASTHTATIPTNNPWPVGSPSATGVAYA